jgi:hypothetical protein
VIFKTEREEKEFQESCPALKLVADYFVYLSINNCGVTPVVTRILRPVEGESGVHQDYRAIDFRDEQGVDGPRLYTPAQASMLVNAINKKFPRTDGKLVCIHHAFTNHLEKDSKRAPYHFHCQIAWAWKNVGLPDNLKEIYKELGA